MPDDQGTQATQGGTPDDGSGSSRRWIVGLAVVAALAIGALAAVLIGNSNDDKTGTTVIRSVTRQVTTTQTILTGVTTPTQTIITGVTTPTTTVLTGVTTPSAGGATAP